MPNYQRLYMPGGSYFFTVVTYGRQNIFNNNQHCSILKNAFKHVMKNHPFSMNAYVILPDHIHCIWTMPENDCNFSLRWRLIKRIVTKHLAYLNTPIWQKRFWEHCIQNQPNWDNCMDYIHYNPVKHNHVASPKDWAQSSFHAWVNKGRYDINWRSQ